MAFLFQYVFPVFILLTFLVALVAVSARIFLPSDLAAPAPIEEISPPPLQQAQAPGAETLSSQSLSSPALR